MYYYEGRSYDDLKELLIAVRDDLDACFSDSDLDYFIREIGGVYYDGDEYLSSTALRHNNMKLYLESRREAIGGIMSEIKEGVEMGMFPIRVPCTYGVIECSD